MIDTAIAILLIEDNPGDARLIREMLAEAQGLRVMMQRAGNLAEGLRHVSEGSFDVILLDLSLPDSTGIETFKAVRDRAPNTPVLILTGLDDESIAIRAAREGAQDYLPKGNLGGNLLARAIKYAIERSKIEKALRGSEIQYRSTLDSMGDAIHVVDADLRFVLFNKTFKQWNERLGIPTDVIGKTVFEVFPFLVERVRREYQRVFETGEALITEERQTIGEKEFITETRKIPVFEGKRVVSIVTVIRDITEQRKAEQALRDSEGKFRALSENSPNMIFINKRGKVLYANRRCEEIIGYKKEEFYAPDFDYLSLVAPEFQEIVRGNFRRHMQGEEVSPFEFVNITRDGRRIESMLTTRLIDYEGDKAILGIVTDITRLKEAEMVLKRDKETFERLVNEKTQELLRIQKKLSDARRLSDIGMLATTVAHELRNPLAVIETAAYNIRFKTQDASLDRHLKKIEKQIAESNQIINNLLFYSRIKTPCFEPMDIRHTLDECIGDVLERVKDKGISIRKQWDIPGTYCIEADPLQIKEVFNNILNNACDAMKDRRGTIDVGIRHEGNGFVSIYVKDSGSGISEENLKMVYEPFFSTKSKGTGLGLTVCFQIVNLHDGGIHMESIKDKGTTVTVTLPIQHARK